MFIVNNDVLVPDGVLTQLAGAMHIAGGGLCLETPYSCARRLSIAGFQQVQVSKNEL